jgi:hypothetical protein
MSAPAETGMAGRTASSGASFASSGASFASSGASFTAEPLSVVTTLHGTARVTQPRNGGPRGA